MCTKCKKVDAEPGKKRCARCREAEIRNQRAYRERLGSEKRRDQTLRYKYGITLEEYEARKAAQEDRCGICRRHIDEIEPPTKTATEKLVVDHCHDSGDVRGLLCAPCNMAIGLFKDNPEYLQQAIQYLQQ